MQVTEGPFDWPLPDEEVRAAMLGAYEDGSWGKYFGPHCEALASALCERFDCEKALLCSSGTLGVELSLRGCGVSQGDEVLLSGYDFPGNFRAVEALGARPVLVDVDPNTWCMEAEVLNDCRRKAVKAMIVSHLHGGLADMPRLMAIARERGWLVVEDACQQPGARLEDRPIGSWGDVGVLSFGGSKLLTAGRGGAVLTSNLQIHQRMKIFTERGNSAFPLSELQAAVLGPQLAKLEARNLERSARVAQIRKKTANLSQWLRPIECGIDGQPAFYKLAWSLLAAEEEPQLREALIAKLQAAGVPIDVGFRGFTQRSSRRCEKLGTLDTSKRLGQSTLLLHHPLLLASEKAAQQVCQILDNEVRRLVS